MVTHVTAILIVLMRLVIYFLFNAILVDQKWIIVAQKNAKKLPICHMNREKSLGKESIIVIKFSKKGAQML